MFAVGSWVEMVQIRGWRQARLVTGAPLKGNLSDRPDKYNAARWMAGLAPLAAPQF